MHTNQTALPYYVVFIIKCYSNFFAEMRFNFSAGNCRKRSKLLLIAKVCLHQNVAIPQISNKKLLNFGFFSQKKVRLKIPIQRRTNYVLEGLVFKKMSIIKHKNLLSIIIILFLQNFKTYLAKTETHFEIINSIIDVVVSASILIE